MSQRSWIVVAVLVAALIITYLLWPPGGVDPLAPGVELSDPIE